MSVTYRDGLMRLSTRTVFSKSLPTRWTHSARAAARLTAVVVLPTPPFWLMMAIRRMRTPVWVLRGRAARGFGSCGGEPPGAPGDALGGTVAPAAGPRAARRAAGI